MSDAIDTNSIRRKILQMVNKGGAAHIGSAFSMVEILCAVYKSCNVEKIKNQDKDRDIVILSKGHGASGLYAVMNHFGLISNCEIDQYFNDGSKMAGHASHEIKYVEHSTGALGHGLSVGLGFAIGGAIKKFKNKVFVILGDGELHEGSNWEAMMLAGHMAIPNLYVLVDGNGLSQLGSVDKVCTLNPLKQKFESFNFKVFQVENGNSTDDILEALEEAKNYQLPTAIICNTTKGKGVSFMEGNNLWHYRTPRDADYKNAMIELDGSADA